MVKAPFWMVFCPNNGPPTFMHPSRDAAECEAQRLARLNPGATFFVLETVCAVTKREFDVTEFRRAAPKPSDHHSDSDFSF